MKWLMVLIFAPTSIFSMQHEWAGYVNPGVLVAGIDERHEEFDEQIRYLLWQCIPSKPAPDLPAAPESNCVADVVGKQPAQPISVQQPAAVSFTCGTICVKCGKYFNSRSALFYHRRRYHMSTVTFVCPASECSKRYASRVTLANHLCKIHHLIVFKAPCVYCCPVDGCGHRYSQQQWLFEHLMIAHNYRHNISKID